MIIINYNGINAVATGVEKLKHIACKEYEGGLKMPKYILLSNLTAEGRKKVKENPQRIKEVNKEIEEFGAKVLDQYALIGSYDFLNILEAPDNEAILRVAVELGSRGTVHITNMPAIPVDEFITQIKK